MIRHAGLAMALLATACVAKRPPAVAPGPASPCDCSRWSAPTLAGQVESPALVELSGLAASRLNPGVLYAHNDSGDTARFFALSTTGKHLAEFQLDGGTARDWEDVAVGPCGEASCVFLGDLGDNRRVRSDYAIYRLPEPRVAVGAAPSVVSVDATRFAYQYPGGEPHNAEALLVHPKTGRVFLLTKESPGTRSLVFRFPEPLSPAALNTLEPVAALSVPTPSDLQVTAADFNPCGTAVLVRLYNRAVLLEGEGDAVWAAAPREVPAPPEPQGEAIAFSLDGRAYFTSTEKKADTVPLSVVRCVP